MTGAARPIMAALSRSATSTAMRARRSRSRIACSSNPPGTTQPYPRHPATTRLNGAFWDPLPDCTKRAKLRALTRGAADRIEVPPPEFRGAEPARALHLLKKLEPNIKQGGASFVRDRRSLSGMVRPSSHGSQNAPRWLKNGCHGEILPWLRRFPRLRVGGGHPGDRVAGGYATLRFSMTCRKSVASSP
jgi:hypothetical protein